MSKKFVALIVCISIIFTACQAKVDPKNSIDEQNQQTLEESSPTQIELTPEEIEGVSKYDLDSKFEDLSDELLFDSPYELPLDDEANLMQNKLGEGLSSYGTARVDVALYNMMVVLRADVGLYEGFEKHEKGFWEISEGRPFNIGLMIENLESLKGYVNNYKVEEDIETAQKLLIYSKENEQFDGIFYAHHIISDLAFWGYLYGFDIERYSSYRQLDKVPESEIYYGITKTWGNEYPTAVVEMCANYDEVEFDKEIFSLKDRIEEVDMKIANIVNEIPDEDRLILVQKLSYWSDYIEEVVENRVLVKDKYIISISDAEIDMALKDINGCIELLPESPLKSDLKTAYKYIELAKGEKDLFFDNLYVLVIAQEMIYEIQSIILQNDKPGVDNVLYIGYLLTLEDNTFYDDFYYYVAEEKPYPESHKPDVDFLLGSLMDKL